MRKFIVFLLLFFAAAGVSFAKTKPEASVSDVKSNLDKYRGKLDAYIIFSNQTILSQIEESKTGKEISDVNKLREFNINLEICKDIQVLLERYYIYLSWLSDLYGLKQAKRKEVVDSVIIKEIAELENKIIANLDFEINKYLPSFIPDITDQTIGVFGKDVLKTLSEIKSYIEEMRGSDLEI
jgi:hypothetical protein